MKTETMDQMPVEMPVEMPVIPKLVEMKSSYPTPKPIIKILPQTPVFTTSPVAVEINRLTKELLLDFDYLNQRIKDDGYLVKKVEDAITACEKKYISMKEGEARHQQQLLLDGKKVVANDELAKLEAELSILKTSLPTQELLNQRHKEWMIPIKAKLIELREFINQDVKIRTDKLAKIMMWAIAELTTLYPRARSVNSLGRGQDILTPFWKSTEILNETYKNNLFDIIQKLDKEMDYPFLFKTQIATLRNHVMDINIVYNAYVLKNDSGLVNEVSDSINQTKIPEPKPADINQIEFNQAQQRLLKKNK